MANVKVFADNQWTGQKQYAPDQSMRGHKNHLYSNLKQFCNEDVQ